MDINKSSRHSKIVGDFGEQIVSNWLSRSGWQVVSVDHTGIDIIAYHRKSGKRIGVTVKSRTRKPGTETESVNLFLNRTKDDRKKIQMACKDFGCEPWIAVYVEAKESADLYLTSLANYDAKYQGSGRKVIDDWKMSKHYIQQYASDSKIHHIHLEFEEKHWRW
jgi:Holliday junction resolvase-like predicted endonuclease